MMNTDSKKTPCNGQIPDDWQMPDLKGFVQSSEKTVYADFRTQSAPTPLVATLKILKQLSEGQHFSGRYPQLPVHLLTHLEEDGWSWTVVEQDPESVLLKIFRDGDKS